jgi:hypothetical protein
MKDIPGGRFKPSVSVSPHILGITDSFEHPVEHTARTLAPTAAFILLHFAPSIYHR